MRKLIAAINMTLDGFCDHTAGLPDEAIHQHYTELLGQGDAILYGRTTYQLMEFWRTFLENPSEEKSMNDFDIAIDKIPKIVFSHTLKDVGPIAIGWESATLANRSVEEPEERCEAARGHRGDHHQARGSGSTADASSGAFASPGGAGCRDKAGAASRAAAEG